MTMLDDERIDQRLRRAGERLRHEAPSKGAVDVALAHVLERPAEPGRRRSLTPLVIGAVAAAAVAIFVLGGRSEDVGEQGPADTPATDAPAMDVPPLATIETSAADFDGDGGYCIELTWDDPGIDGARGCLTGDQVRSGRRVQAAIEHGAYSLVTVVQGGVVSSASFNSCSAGKEAVPRFVDAVTCGARTLFGVLPATPDGEVEWSLRDVAGRTVPLSPVSIKGPILVFDVPSARDRPCLVLASALAGGDWVDACSPLPTVRALTRVGGRPAVVGPAADTVEILDAAAAAARLGCADLGRLLQAVEPTGGVTVRLTCAGDLAVAVQGRAELELGRSGVYVLLLERDGTGGGWTVVEDGPSLPCAPAAVCAVFGPADDLADAAAPIPPL